MAVYTEVSDDDLARFIASYGLGSLLSYKGIAEGVENTNYLVHATGGTFILTLYEKRVDPGDLPFFLGLMEHLAARDVTCPVPVRDTKGSNLNALAGRHAALVTFLEGVWPRKPSAGHCLELGRALAKMHLAGDGFALSRANALSLSGWRPLFDKFSSRADEILPGLGKLIEQELQHLKHHWPQDLPQGVIHADLFPDNVFFIGGKLSGLIDFYFACNDALAYDIAVCLNAWCFEADFAFNATKGRALLKGYNEVRQLTAAERMAMPLLARGAAMRFLLTRSYDWLNTPKNAFVARKDPFDYVRRLRFHQGVKSITDYGADAASKDPA
jgi:homoserine kinase type II